MVSLKPSISTLTLSMVVVGVILSSAGCVESMKVGGVVTDAHKTWMATDEHVYGQLVIRGAVQPIEFFRATFGSLVPCASRDIVVADDIRGCTEPGPEVKGKLVVVERGNCTFVHKAHVAQRAGAAGVVIVNLGGGLIRPPMGNLTASNVTIPVVMVRNHTLPVLQALSSSGAQLHGALTVMDKCRLPKDERTGPLPLDDKGNVMQKAVQAGGEVDEGSVAVKGGSEWQYIPPGAGSWKPSLTRAGVVNITPTPGTSAPEFYMGFFGGVLPSEPLPLAWTSPRLACDTIENPAALAGAWAIVERGSCDMAAKAYAVEATGARGMLIVNSGEFGLVRPAARDDIHDLTIAVAMVARDTGALLDAAIAADGTVLLENRPENDGRGWESLLPDTKLVLPADAVDRIAILEDHVQRHHPGSPQGHAARWLRFTALAEEAGFIDEVSAVAAQYVLKSAKASAQDSSLRSLPVPITTLQHFPVGALGDDQKLVRCHMVGGKFVFSKPEWKEASKQTMYSRLGDAILNMACMEHLMYKNAEAIGNYYHHLMQIEDNRPHMVRTLRGIFRRLWLDTASPMRDAQAIKDLLEGYESLAQSADSIMDVDPNMSIRDFLAKHGFDSGASVDGTPSSGEIDV